MKLMAFLIMTASISFASLAEEDLKWDDHYGRTTLTVTTIDGEGVGIVFLKGDPAKWLYNRAISRDITPKPMVNGKRKYLEVYYRGYECHKREGFIASGSYRHICQRILSDI